MFERIIKEKISGIFLIENLIQGVGFLKDMTLNKQVGMGLQH